MDRTPEPPLCPDWVFLNNSNVHIAKDRGWFKTYTPFASILEGQPVLGIGTVELLTKRSPNLSGVAAHGSLHLTEVLHVPSFICNMLGQPILSNGYGVTIGGGKKSHGHVEDSEGKHKAYFDPTKEFYTLKLRGPPAGPQVGPSSFKEGVMFMLWSRWDAAERQKWQEFKKQNKSHPSKIPSVDTNNDNPPYTADEKEFLKQYWAKPTTEAALASQWHVSRSHSDN